MIEVYNKNFKIDTGEYVPLPNVALLKGNTVELEGDSTLLFNRKGVYMLTLSSSIDRDAIIPTTSTVGDPTPSPKVEPADFVVSLQLEKDGVLVPNALTLICADPALEIQVGSGSFTTLVQVDHDNCPCNCCTTPTRVKVINNGGSNRFKLVDIAVTKIC